MVQPDRRGYVIVRVGKVSIRVGLFFRGGAIHVLQLAQHIQYYARANEIIMIALPI